ncbi:MAG: penicillin-binding protein, partial [Marmoricola sp.]|nr:penicillin-binding protein [Marmoricola sp.]
RVARLVGVDPQAFAKEVAATGPRAFVQAIVFRRNEVPPKVLAGLSAIPGGSAISDHLPLSPSKDFASAVLGSVGPATADVVKKSQGKVHAGDDVGLSGLQARYDDQLRGTSGEEVVAVDQPGNRRVLFSADPVAGKPLQTTLDPTLETLAQRLLAGVGPASALVAVRPSTGALVAVASGPGSKGYNTATYGRYAPGSTFKIVSALALLRAGETPSTTVPCTPTTVVDGKQFKNYSDYPSSQLGRITLETALANSCNTAFVSQHTRLGPTSLAQAAAALGFGVDHDTGFPTFFGSVGPAGSQTQAAASMIGQGTVLASPMAMATVVASVLKGSAVVPSLLPAQKTSAPAPAHPLTSTEAARLRTMMRAVVTRGSGARLAGLPGQVIAKTGTAEFGNKPPLPTHAWMVAGRGDLAVAVFVDRGQTGSQTAGPILQAFLEQAR